jgi:hypothetical protein
MMRGRSRQRSATGPSGGRSDAHPLPPRQVPGSLAGAVTSTVFMLAPGARAAYGAGHLPVRIRGDRVRES